MCLEDQIKQCAKDCGLCEADAQKCLKSGVPVGALGDGVLLGKFLAFLQAILPFILPLITTPTDPAKPTS